jgi:hypothetical protein
MRRLSRTAATALTAAAATILSASGALAYWTSQGSGTVPGNTGTGHLITISPDSPTTGLYPGGHSDVTATLTNANTLEMAVGSFVLDTSQGTSGFAVDGGHSGCAVSTLTFTTATNSGSGWTVPAKVAGVNGTLPVTLTNALAMGVGAANACQGAAFTVYLAAGP